MMRLSTAQRADLQAWAREQCRAIADDVAYRLAEAIEALSPDEGQRVAAMGWREAGEYTGVLPLGGGSDQ